MLTKTQIKKIEKATRNKTGVDIKISKTQIRKSVKHGGSLFSSLLSLGTKLLPLAAKPLAKNARSALGNLEVNKINFWERAGWLASRWISDSKRQNELLIKNKNLSTQKQKEHVLNSLQSGGQVVMRPTQKQRGGALGTLLASIGIPLAMELGKKLFGQGLGVPSRGLRGKGLSVPSRNRGKGLQLGPKPGMMMYQPPPFIGKWENPTGPGTKKKNSGQGLLFGKNSPFNPIPMLGSIF